MLYVEVVVMSILDSRYLNRLRSTHFYSDTIKIVKEMLFEKGLEGKFGDIMVIKDFFQYYVFIN